MRICAISHSYLVALNQRKYALLAAMGDDITVVVPARGYDMGRTFLPERLPGGHHFSIVASQWYRHMYWFSFHHGELVRAISAARPDVIYLEEEPQSLAALQVVLIAAARHVPLVLFTWENLVRCYTAPQRWWCRWVLGRVDHLIGGSARAIAVAEQWGYQGNSSVLPQFGIDTGLYNTAIDGTVRQRLGLGGQFVIGWVARVIAAKGIFTLIEALAGFPADWRLLAVGDGPERAAAQRMAGRYGIGERIIWAGAARHTDVPSYLKAMDVMVLPSLPTPDWEEQFGHVLIEAMACGVPVIGSDSGAIPEVIGDAGLVFHAGDAVDLQDKLNVLAGNESLRRRLRQAGSERAVTMYSDERIATQLGQILHGRGGRLHG